MVDKIDITNAALVLIGANEIASFDDDSSEGTTARRIYPATLDDLLSRYPWRFMTGQIQMARLADNPVARWTSSYQIPSGAAEIRAVTVDDFPIPFDRYEDKIYCNAGSNDEVILDYVKEVNEEFFPGYFVALLQFQLASNFAIPIGDRTDLMEAYEKKALRHFSLARNVDAQGRTAKRMPVGRFTRVRNG